MPKDIRAKQWQRQNSDLSVLLQTWHASPLSPTTSLPTDGSEMSREVPNSLNFLSFLSSDVDVYILEITEWSLETGHHKRSWKQPPEVMQGVLSGDANVWGWIASSSGPTQHMRGYPLMASMWHPVETFKISGRCF